MKYPFSPCLFSSIETWLLPVILKQCKKVTIRLPSFIIRKDKFDSCQFDKPSTKIEPWALLWIMLLKKHNNLKLLSRFEINCSTLPKRITGRGCLCLLNGTWFLLSYGSFFETKRMRTIRNFPSKLSDNKNTFLLRISWVTNLVSIFSFKTSTN